MLRYSPFQKAKSIGFLAEEIRQRLNPSRLNPNIAHRLAFVKQIVAFAKLTAPRFGAFNVDTF